MLSKAGFFLFAHLLVTTNAYVSDGNAFGWRMPCGQFPQFSRIDPIVSPDEASNHAHAFHGSSRFHATADYSDLRASNCSSCRAVQDKSSYWVPPLYFRDTNGTYSAVNNVGGILAYYMRRDDVVKAFPQGFRMIAGDTDRNTSTIPFLDDWDTSSWGPNETNEATARQRALGFNCLNYAKAGEATLYRHGMPDKDTLQTCTDGLRVEIAFPSCWNGKDLDSPDHKSHVAYEPFVYKGSPCPADFPIRLPVLLYEVIWDVAALASQAGDFVFANGDITGYGSHGDFMTGWDPSFLQQALDECKNNVGDIDTLPCNLMTLQDTNGCQAEDYEVLPVVAHETCNGNINELCGSQNWQQPQVNDDPLSDPPPAPFLAGPSEGSFPTTQAQSPSSVITTPTISKSPNVVTTTIIEQTTVIEDVWVTVLDKKKRHGHMHYHDSGT